MTGSAIVTSRPPMDVETYKGTMYEKNTAPKNTTIIDFFLCANQNTVLKNLHKNTDVVPAHPQKLTQVLDIVPAHPYKKNTVQEGGIVHKFLQEIYHIVLYKFLSSIFHWSSSPTTTTIDSKNLLNNACKQFLYDKSK